MAANITRKLGFVTATSLVVANMVGSGIFVTSGIMSANLPGPGWVLFCWFFGGLIAMSGALCYSELSTRMPEEGAEYVYLKRIYHPVLGFLTGWTSLLVGFSGPIAGSAMGFSEYLFAGFGLAKEIFPFSKKAISIFIIILFTLFHYLGIRLGSALQNVLTAVKIVIIVGLTSMGLFAGQGQWSHFSANAAAADQNMAFGTAMMFVMFAYAGWNASAYIAGEVKRPRRNLPFSLLTGTAIVIIMYLAINIFIFYALPYTQVSGTITVVKNASVASLGNWIGDLFGILIAIALLSSLSAFIMIGPRVYFAMARDGLFFKFAADVHPRYGVPGRSILLQGALAVFMVVVSSLQQLLLYIGYALSFFPWLAIIGLFLARKRNIGGEEAVRVPIYPITPIFYLAASLSLMIIAFINRPFESSAAIVTVLCGLPCYYVWIKWRKKTSKVR